MTANSRESVFVARNSVEENVAERALRAEGIEYSVAAEATEKPDGAVCFLAIVYQVAAGDATRARAALESAGLGHGIVARGEGTGHQR